jgi:hypothetical protein
VPSESIWGISAKPYLPRVTVATTSAKAYLALLGGAAA